MYQRRKFKQKWSLLRVYEGKFKNVHPSKETNNLEMPLSMVSERHGGNARPKHILQHVSAHIALKDVRGGETKVNCPRYCGWCGSNQNLCVINSKKKNWVTRATTMGLPKESNNKPLRENVLTNRVSANFVKTLTFGVITWVITTKENNVTSKRCSRKPLRKNTWRWQQRGLS